MAPLNLANSPTTTLSRDEASVTASISHKAAEVELHTILIMHLQTISDVYIDAELLRKLLAKLFRPGQYRVQVRTSAVNGEAMKSTSVC